MNLPFQIEQCFIQKMFLNWTRQILSFSLLSDFFLNLSFNSLVWSSASLNVLCIPSNVFFIYAMPFFISNCSFIVALSFLMLLGFFDIIILNFTYDQFLISILFSSFFGEFFCSFICFVFLPILAACLHFYVLGRSAVTPNLQCRTMSNTVSDWPWVS